jgi:hypothetical protein
MMSSAANTTVPVENPFKFLNYYEEQEKDQFAGREDEIHEVLVGVTRGRSYVLYGRSGLGKTSLLLAGVFPGLRERGFQPVYIRLLESPVKDFCAALAATHEAPELAREMPLAERLVEVPRALARISAQAPLIIALDQFEEFFIRFRSQPQLRADFVSLVGHIIREPSANVRFLVSLREDYLAQLNDLRPALPDITAYSLRLLPLTAYGTRQAIVLPLIKARVDYEEPLLAKLVDLLDGFDFDPPLLQIVCTELYREATERQGTEVRLQEADLQRVGGLDGIFHRYLAKVGQQLEDKRLLVRVVLNALITTEETKRAVRAEDLRQDAAFEASLEEVEQVLALLRNQGLVRGENRLGQLWYELLHERLVPIVRRWLSADEDFLKFRFAKNFVRNTSENGPWRTSTAGLLSPEQIERLIEPWKERLRLREDELEFLLRSSIYHQSQSTRYWADRLEERSAGRVPELLKSLLGDSAAQMRRGAASSVGELKVLELVGRCLELGLNDPSPEVRRIAGATLAHRMSAQEWSRLQRALVARETRPAALELLADLHEQGASIIEASWNMRRRARAIVHQRRRHHHRDAIRAREGAGAFAGMVAGLVGGAAFILLGFVVLALSFGEGTRTDSEEVKVWNMLIALLGAAGAGGIVGVLGGWLVARSSGHLAAIERKGSWWRAVAESKYLGILCLPPLFIVSLFVSESDQRLLEEFLRFGEDIQLPGALFLVSFLFAVLAWLVTIGFVALGERCIARDLRSARPYLWAALCTWPFASLGSVMVIFELGDSEDSLSVFPALSLYESAFLGLIFLCALVRSQSRAPIAQEVTTLRGVVGFRLATVLTGLGLVGMLLGVLGIDTLPLFAPWVDLSSGEPLKGTLSARWPDSDYFKLVLSPRGEPPERWWMSVSRSDGCRVELIVHGEQIESDYFLISTQQTRAVVSRTAPAGEQECAYEISLREEKILTGKIEGLGMRPVFATVPLTFHRERETLEGTLKLVIPPAEQDKQDKEKGNPYIQLVPSIIGIDGLPSDSCLEISASPEWVADDSVEKLEKFYLQPALNKIYDLERLGTPWSFWFPSNRQLKSAWSITLKVKLFRWDDNEEPLERYARERGCKKPDTSKMSERMGSSPKEKPPKEFQVTLGVAAFVAYSEEEVVNPEEEVVNPEEE